MAKRRQQPSKLPWGVTRRNFLAGAAGWMAGGAALDRVWAQVAGSDEKGSESSRVVVAEGPGLIQSNIVNKHDVHSLFCKGLIELFQTPDPSDAWRRVLGNSTRIALKFNGAGAEALATHPPLAASIVRTLGEAGYPPEDILAVELPPSLATQLGVKSGQPQWTDDEIDFGSGRDKFAHFLTKIDALVNVSFLKHHNIAGFSACLKNLSHGLIKHPARFHGTGCNPYIADIVAQPIIKNVLKLNIINGLRVVFDKGPEPGMDNVSDSESILIGTDPVAVDTVGAATLDRIRQARGLAKVAATMESIPYLVTAGSRGLGEHRYHAIDVRKVTL